MSFTKSVTRLVRFFNEKRFKPFAIEKQANGDTFQFWIGDLDGKDWYLDSAEEGVNAEMEFLRTHMIEPGEVIFECGTHHGWTTMLISKWAGLKGKVVGFEINPKNADIAEKNFDLNNCQNIILERKGAGAENRAETIFRKSNASVVPKNKLSIGFLKNAIYGFENIDIVSLDSYANDMSLKPSLLKLDVEGYETEVLKGAAEILKTCPKLAIEIHTEVLARHNTSVQEILDLVGVERYDCWIQWEDDQAPLPYDFKQAITKRVHLFALPKKS